MYLLHRTTIQDSIEEEYTRTYETSPGKLETATIHLKLEPLPRGSGIQLLMNGDYSDFLPNNKRMRTEILEVVKQALSVRVHYFIIFYEPLKEHFNTGCSS